MRDGHQVARCAAHSVPVTDLRETPIKTAEDVDEMLRLRGCGWGAKRIGRHLGGSHHTVKRYLEAGRAVAFGPPARVRALDGHVDWLRERLLRHRGSADVVRQELIDRKDVLVTFRKVMRQEV